MRLRLARRIGEVGRFVRFGGGPELYPRSSSRCDGPAADLQISTLPQTFAGFAVGLE